MKSKEDKSVPSDEEMEPVAFSNGSGGNRSHLLCKVGESFEECIERHTQAGWTVSADNAEAVEVGDDQIKLVFKQP